MTEQEPMIGASLRNVRRRQGLTLRQVAESAGVTESFLSQVERDIASPSIATLRRIAVALGMSIGEILDQAGPHGQLVRAADRRGGRRSRWGGGEGGPGWGGGMRPAPRPGSRTATRIPVQDRRGCSSS